MRTQKRWTVRIIEASRLPRTSFTLFLCSCQEPTWARLETTAVRMPAGPCALGYGSLRSYIYFYIAVFLFLTLENFENPVRSLMQGSAEPDRSFPEYVVQTWLPSTLTHTTVARTPTTRPWQACLQSGRTFGSLVSMAICFLEKKSGWIVNKKRAKSG